jgi:hypothetical protein
MDANALRALQAPKSTAPTLRRHGSPSGRRGFWDDAKIACKAETGRALVVAGLHPATGGSRPEACSGDMLLEPLVACAGVTMKAVAVAIGVELPNAKLRAEGDLDFGAPLAWIEKPLWAFPVFACSPIDSDAWFPSATAVAAPVPQKRFILNWKSAPFGLATLRTIRSSTHSYR